MKSGEKPLNTIQAKQLGDIFYLMTYVKGSLRNAYSGGERIGFRFNLDNPPLALGGVAIDFKLLLDGSEVDPSLVWIRQGYQGRNAGTISETRPYTFEVGAPTEWTVLLPGGLAPGEHSIVIVTEQYAFGKIYSRFTIQDEVSDIQEPCLMSTGPFHRPLALSNDASFAVINWAGDLSADWNWWGLVTDNGGLYSPPARYIRQLKWELAERGAAGSYPLVRYTDRADHLPGRLEAYSRFGSLTVQRKVFMSVDDAAVFTRFILSNDGDEAGEVELIGNTEAMLVPYGLLGVKAKQFKFRATPRSIVMENPQLPYVGVIACDADMTASFGTSYEGADPGFHFRIPVKVEPHASVTVTVVLSGDPESKERAVHIASRSLQNAEEQFALAVSSHREYLENTIAVRTGDAELDQAFDFAKLALKNLKFNHPEIGAGICAGFPRFPNYWSRDSAWTAFAYLAIGDMEFVKEVLLNFISLQLEEDRPGAFAGDMPTVISGPGFMHQTSWGGSAEGVLLQTILFREYVYAAQDTEFAKAHFSSIQKSMAWAQRCDRDGDGFLEHGIVGDVSTSQAFTIPDTQWMDHIDRRKSSNDVQGLYWHALRAAADVAGLVGEPEFAREWSRKADIVERKYEEEFWFEDGGYYYDRLLEDGTPDPTLRPNYAVNLMFSTLADAERVKSSLERLESEEMTTPFGLRTRSSKDEGKGYDPSSYQEGAVWNLTTGWTAMAEFKAGRAEQGVAFLRMIASRILDEMGMAAELYRANKPEPLNGCFLQAWSIGMYVWGFVRYHQEIKRLTK